jgi:hypothetical protein
MLTRRAQREVRQTLKNLAVGALMGALISAALFLPLILN